MKFFHNMLYLLPLLRAALACCVIVLFTAALSGRTCAQDSDLQHRWEYDPNIGAKWTVDPQPVPQTLDLRDLNSEDMQLRVPAMQAATLRARWEVTNQKEAFAAVMQQLAKDQAAGVKNRQAMLATVSAAFGLAANREEAEQVWQLIEGDPIASAVGEPALVKWKSTAALERWRDRLRQGSEGSTEQLVAIDGIAEVGDASDQEILESLLMRPGTTLPIQLAASKALGKVKRSGLEGVAQRLLDSPATQKNLLAANLLARHKSPEAEVLLGRIVESDETVAHNTAYRAIANYNLKNARVRAESFIDHPENNLRMASAIVLNQFNDPASLNIQAKAISDENLGVRETARKNLRKKAARPELRPLVDAVISENLKGARWQGLEQAMILAVELEDNQRAPRFIELLEHPDPMINIRAAWGLQMLSLTETDLDAILRYCQGTTDRLINKEYVSTEEEVRVAFLFEAMGRHAYQPANEMLMIYVPKDEQKMKPLTRASAIYALGYIWAGKKNPPLTQELARRMLDNNPNDPESRIVQYTSATALGRIGDPDIAPKLRQIGDTPPAPIAIAGAWALKALEQSAP